MLDTLQHYWEGLTTDREQFLSERQQHMQASPPMFLYRGEFSEVSGHFREMDIDAAAAWVELATAVAEAWPKDRDVVRQWDRYEHEVCNCCQLMRDLTSLPSTPVAEGCQACGPKTEMLFASGTGMGSGNCATDVS
jgi:hypothetical protein